MAKETSAPSGKPTSAGHVPTGQQTARISTPNPMSSSPMSTPESAPCTEHKPTKFSSTCKE